MALALQREIPDPYMANGALTFDPSDPHSINRVVFAIAARFRPDESRIQSDETDPYIQPGLHRCHFVSQGRVELEAEACSQDAVRAADVICLGGIDHAQKTIGALPAKIDGLLTAFGKESLSALQVLAYNPHYERTERLIDAYEWNADKAFISPEMRSLADKIWQAKFLEHGKLVPPEAFPGFSLLTYSFGARMSMMLENWLRARLREHGASEKRIDDYFSRIKRISIASAVDVAKLEAPTLHPRIETVHYLAQADRGVAYWKPFHHRFIAGPVEGMPDNAPLRIELAAEYGKAGERQHLMLFPQEKDPLNDNGHGLSYYMEKMKTMNERQRDELADALFVARRPGMVVDPRFPLRPDQGISM